MKHTRVSLLALSALAGGVFVASAAPPVDMGTNYPIGIIFPNPQTLVWVSGLPTLATNALDSNGDFGYTTTDGSGKINGVAYLTTTNLSGAAPFTTAVMIADVSGTINSSGKPAQPNVKIAVKGNGYCEDYLGTTQAMATISYNFTSVGGVSNHVSQVTPPLTNILLHTIYNYGYTNYVLHTYSPSTNAGSSANTYYSLSFEVSSNYSQASTVASNVTQTNYFAIYNSVGQFSNNIQIYFGTPLSTNAVDTNYIGTNVFYRYLIYTNTATTAYQWGLSAADVPTAIPTFINISTSTNVDTNTSTTTIVYTLGVTTNTYTGSTNAGSVNLWSPPLTTSNGWQQVDGTVKGTIKAGKTSVSLNGNASLTSESGFVYTIGAADTNGTVLITATQLTSANNVDIFTFDSLYGQVVSFGKNFWMSDDSSYTYSGKGNLTTKASKTSGTNTSYKASIKGVTYYDTGMSLSLSGTNGLLVLHLSAITNMTSYSNIAASPVISQTLTNDSEDYSITVDLGPVTTTNTVSGTNITAVSFWSAPVDPAFTSNSVPNAILSMDAKGKVYGQAITVTNGANLDY